MFLTAGNYKAGNGSECSRQLEEWPLFPQTLLSASAAIIGNLADSETILSSVPTEELTLPHGKLSFIIKASCLAHTSDAGLFQSLRSKWKVRKIRVHTVQLPTSYYHVVTLEIKEERPHGCKGRGRHSAGWRKQEESAALLRIKA